MMDTEVTTTPRPDPTAATSAQLLRELAGLRDFLNVRIDHVTDSLKELQTDTANAAMLATSQRSAEIRSLEALLNVRLSAMDKATELAHSLAISIPSDTDKQIRFLQSLHEEKFRSIEIQFKERDTRTEQTSKDSKVAVDAALQAAKEAVGEQNKSSALAIAKSEAATTKQIDQLQVLIQTGSAAANDKIEDIKARLTLIEGRTSGNQSAVVDQRASQSSTLGMIGGVVGVLGLLAGVVLAIVK